MDRLQAIEWLAENLSDWPEKIDGLTTLPITPDSWEWKMNGLSVMLMKSGCVSINRVAWYEVMRALPQIVAPFPKMGFNEPPKPEGVTDPPHYLTIDEIRAIEIIAAALTLDEWRGYCLGNFMKYRLRAGKKDDLLKDIGKADEHDILFERYKKFCRGAR